MITRPATFPAVSSEIMTKGVWKFWSITATVVLVLETLLFAAVVHDVREQRESREKLLESCRTLLTSSR